MMTPRIGGLYRHLKTHAVYKVTEISLHTETGEKLVTYYDAHHGGPAWTRPYSMFVDGRFVEENESR